MSEERKTSVVGPVAIDPAIHPAVAPATDANAAVVSVYRNGSAKVGVSEIRLRPYFAPDAVGIDPGPLIGGWLPVKIPIPASRAVGAGDATTIPLPGDVRLIGGCGKA